jgi:hypothetical protein
MSSTPAWIPSAIAAQPAAPPSNLCFRMANNHPRRASSRAWPRESARISQRQQQTLESWRNVSEQCLSWRQVLTRTPQWQSGKRSSTTDLRKLAWVLASFPLAVGTHPPLGAHTLDQTRHCENQQGDRIVASICPRPAVAVRTGSGKTGRGAQQ